MGNTHARFRVVDIERILRAAKNADVSVRVEIDGDKIFVENIHQDDQKPVEIKEPIIL